MIRPVTGTGFILDIGAQHRLFHDAVILAFQPMIPPALRFLQKADRRARNTILRIDMRPRADNAEPRNLESGKKARQCIGVCIRPTAGDHDRNIDCIPILTNGAMLPIGIAPLVIEPERRPKRHMAEACKPAIAPCFTDNCGIKRARLIGEHDRTPPEIIIEQAPAHIVDVIGVAIIRRTYRKHSLERWRPACGNLQTVKAAPGFSHHADRTGAPWLSGKPFDHFNRVILFLLDIFIIEETVRLA